MPSNDTIFVVAGFVEDGFFELLVPVVVPPTVIDLGAPGDATFALPFRALGGSVLDLDLLYGLVQAQATQEDIQPMFFIGTREGMIRGFGYEQPRAAIRDACVETFATLKALDDITIEGSPLGPNLFGSVGLTTLPTVTVTLDNSDGVWNQLILRELVMYSPAGLFADIGHTALAPVVTGAMSAIQFQGADVLLTFGFSARATGSPSLTPRLNLDQMLRLRTAGEYANPGSETDILPEVFGHWLAAEVGTSGSTAVGTPAVLIDRLNLVYCVNARRTANDAPVVMCNGVIQDPSTYQWNPADNYEGRGIIATLTFQLNFVTTTVVSVRHGGAVDGSGVPITNPFLMLRELLIDRAHWTINTFDRGSCDQTRRDLETLGYPAYGVFHEERSIRDWLLEVCPQYHCDFVETGNAQLAIILDRTLTTLPVTADYHIPAWDVEDGGTPATAVALSLHGDDVVNQVTLQSHYNWSTNESTSEYRRDYQQSQSAYQTAYPAEFTLRGLYTNAHAARWLDSFALRHGFDPTLVSFTLRGLKGLPLMPPRLVTLEWPQFGWSEHLMKIVKTTISFRDHRVTIEAIDCQRELDELPDDPGASPTVLSRPLSRIYQWLPGTVGDQGLLQDAPGPTKNEAANGDFELGDNGQWNLKDAGGTVVWTIEEDPTKAYQGRFYARSVAGMPVYGVRTLRRRIDPGEWVMVSGWFRDDATGADGTGRTFVEFYGTERQALGFALGNPAASTSAYLESVLLAQAPAGAYHFVPGMTLIPEATVGNWRADKIVATSGSRVELLTKRSNAFEGGNLIFNGNFEAGDVNWNKDEGWYLDTTLPRSGTYHMTHRTTPGPPFAWRVVPVSIIPVIPGQFLRVQAFWTTIADANGSVQMGLTWLNEQFDTLSETGGQIIPGPLPSYTYIGMAAAVPIGPAYALAWGAVMNQTQGFWLIDDFVVWNPPGLT